MSDPISLPELKTSFFRRCQHIAVHLDMSLSDTAAVQAMLTPSERYELECEQLPDLTLARWATLFFRLSDDLEVRELTASLEWHDEMDSYCRRFCSYNRHTDRYDEDNFAVDDDEIPF